MWHWQIPLSNPEENIEDEDHLDHHAENGHQEGEGPAKKKTVTQACFYAYRLHPHPDERSLLFRGRQLFQQFVVDSWAQIDQMHLK